MQETHGHCVDHSRQFSREKACQPIPQNNPAKLLQHRTLSTSGQFLMLIDAAILFVEP